MPDIMKKYAMGDLDENNLGYGSSSKGSNPANNLPKDEVGGQNVDMPKKSKNMVDNIQELNFDLDKQLKINENLNSQIYMYIQSDSLNQVLLEGYKTQLKLKDEMIKVVKPKWYENKWLWFTIGVISTAGSIKLASELVD